MEWKLERELSKKLQAQREPTEEAALKEEGTRLDRGCQGPREKASWLFRLL